ncbi:PAS domain-containing protein cky-1 isoform X2 [Sitodiplosis mosellana]|uniref:PAS domain-containing protein cky-1 isoform X2 n=1 Tax=Sitodiplosis mosellana TaxID=263140 RepID=UPI002443B8D6|nr:PAS domain-containing protein cky-1 isoform X2 [Sitodiplosis mosellana]
MFGKLNQCDGVSFEPSKMFTRFDTNKSTKGASKLRRDLINTEIANLRDLLPLPQSTRQRLSQLQLMALVCVYVRKANYFQQVFKRYELTMHHVPTPNIGFSKAMSGFLMMLTQNGKLLYISDNAAEYLGHSMEDLLIHGDSVYDIIDKQDHGSIQAELSRSVPQQTSSSGSHHHHHHHHHSSPLNASTALDGEHRMFLCRMNVSRNARRQMRFGDQKVVLIQGHYLSYLPLCSRNEPVFLATCTPIAMPETRECIVQGATNVFTTIHSMDMKIMHMDKNGEFHMGYTRNELQGVSWYHLLHWDSMREAQNKHRLITQSEQDRSCILLVQMQRRSGTFVWAHVVLQVRDSQDNSQQPVIVCTNQVLSDSEASVMYANSWLYHYYTVQSKIQFGIPYEGPARVQANNDTYLQQQQQEQQQLPEQNDLHHHHHSFHHYSPNSLQTPLTHSYLTHSHHMPSYGYHSPVAQHQSSPGLVNHYGNSTPHLSYHGSNDGYRPYAYRIDPILPVDYSGHVGPMTTNHNRNSSSGSVKSTNQSNSDSGSPPAKRRAVNRLEPLFIPEHQQETSSDETLHSEPVYQTTTSDGGTVLLTTVVPGRYSHTHIKAISNEPTDLIDQWNPSPPWSETTQKVPDIAQQELCYLSRTPPTPTSAPLTSSNGVAFSFDWMPEQFVPIVDTTHHNNNNNNHTVPNGMTHMGAMLMSAATLSTSPNEHKFYNLDRSPDNDIEIHEDRHSR